MRWNLIERPDALQVFRDYVTIKLHFDGRVNWSPGMGQKLTEKTLRERRDAQFFERVAAKSDTRGEIVERLITAFLYTPDFWIGGYFDDDLTEDHNKRLIYIKSLRFKFEREFESICNYMEVRDVSVKKLLTGAGKPVIMRDRKLIAGGVSDETLAILDHFFNFCDRGETLDPLWERKRRAIARYKYLVIPGEKELEHIENLISKNWLK